MQAALRIDLRKALAVGAVASLLTAALLCLYLFDPAQHAIYPVCYFHRLTGLECPGCGGLRSVHHFLRGDIILAFRFHPLFILSLPFLAYWAAKGTFQMLRREPRAFALRPSTLWIFLAVLVTFGIVRNLPIAFFHPPGL